MDLVYFIATSTVDDNIMKMNVLRLVDGFVKFLQVSSRCNVPRIYDVLEVGVFARTDLSETFNVSAMCFVIVVFCLGLMSVSKRFCLQHCWQEPFVAIWACNNNNNILLFAPISSKIKLNGATKPRDYANL